MLHHLMIHVDSVETSKEFYKQLLDILDMEIKADFGEKIGFGDKESKNENSFPYFWLSQNKSQHAHFAFTANSRELVDSFYKKALELGAKDNGSPNERPYGENYYAAFFIDLDGNNVEIVHQ